MKTVVALFDDFTDAQAAVRDLVNSGVLRRNISMVATDRDQRYARELETMDTESNGDHAAEGAGAGAVAGAAIGGIGGLLVGIGALAIPGVGPIIAAGPIGAALLGAGIGAAAGGIIGALIGWGIPEEEANYFAEGVRRGGTLIGVTTEETNVNRVSEILNRYDPVDLKQRAADWQTTGWTQFDDQAKPYTTTTTSPNLATTRGAYARSYDYKGSFDDVDYGDRSFVDYDTKYRSHYDTTYRTSNYDYADYLNAYRFGSTLGTDTQYTQYSDWNTLEPVARRQWEGRYQDSAWEDFKDAVRHGWNEVKQAVS